MPTNKNGKICYIEIPAADAPRSAHFYEMAFGWNVRERGDGATAFDDTTGEVSGAFVVGRPPSTQVGVLFYIMCDDINASLKAVTDNGGGIVQKVGADPGELTARFRDPGGNTIGLYQEPNR